MNGLKILLLTLILFSKTTSYSQKKFSSAKGLDKIAERIADKIASLPEIIKADNYCKKLSHGKRHLVTFVAGSPGSDGDYYLIKVAEDNGWAFHAWFLFAFYPDNYKIEYIDTSTDSFIPLKKWRKNFRLADL